MTHVIHRERKSAVLTRPGSPVFSGLRCINLTAGCAHECLYCYAVAYCAHPGRQKVVLYTNTVEKLRSELARLRKRPVAVYFGTASDLFQPVGEVLDLAYAVLELLFENGIGVRFLTKGYIPGRHMRLLSAHSEMVRGQVCAITTDAEVTRVFEPYCPAPAIRFAQAEELVAQGIAVEGAIRPILPGVTDDANTVTNLIRAYAKAGVRQVVADSLFLRPPIIGALKRALGNVTLLDRLLAGFKQKHRTRVLHGSSSAIVLPVERRRNTYGLLQEVAKDYGITVRICSGMNPDITDVPCDMAGDLSLNTLHTG